MNNKICIEFRGHVTATDRVGIKRLLNHHLENKIELGLNQAFKIKNKLYQFDKHEDGFAIRVQTNGSWQQKAHRVGFVKNWDPKSTLIKILKWVDLGRDLN